MKIWLFLMLLYLLLGRDLVADVNVEEAVVAMVHGNAEKYLIGILVEMTMPREDGKHIIRLLFLLVVLIRYQTAKFFACLVTRILAPTVDTNSYAG